MKKIKILILMIVFILTLGLFAYKPVEVNAEGSFGDSVSAIKIKASDLPDNDELFIPTDLPGFVAVDREDAIAWTPLSNASNVFLIYEGYYNFYDNTHWSFVEFSNGSYYYDDVTYDSITNNEIRQQISDYGWEYYYTGIKDDDTSTPNTSSKLAAPFFIPDPGKYNFDLNVFIAHERNDGVILYYTLDGSTPNENSNVFTGGIHLTESGTYTIKAIAVLEGMETSDVATGIFIINIGGGNTNGKNGHGFCFGVILLIINILVALVGTAYVLMRLDLFDKSEKIKDLKEKITVKEVLITFITTCALLANFILDLIVLIIHACPLTVISFILSILLLGGIMYWYVKTRRDGQMTPFEEKLYDKIFKKNDETNK